MNKQISQRPVRKQLSFSEKVTSNIKRLTSQEKRRRITQKSVKRYRLTLEGGKIRNDRAHINNTRACGSKYNHSARGSQAVCAQHVRMMGKHHPRQCIPNNHTLDMIGKEQEN